MVRLHTTLLALTLATGSALASSNDYQRRSELVNNQIESRGFEQGFEDEEDLFVRDIDAFDDLEAREPSKYGSAVKAAKFAKGIATSKRTKQVAKGVDRAATAYDIGQQIHSTFQSRGFEDEEDLFERDIDAFDDLEAREPSKFGSAFKAFKFIKKIGGSKRTRRVAKGFNRAANAYDAGQQISNTFRSRGLEDDEYLYGRDLDVEEFFGREYDLLEERDAIDDLD